MHPLSRAVEALIRRVAAEIMIPRFRALTTDEVSEKEPGDFVTIVDKESEAFLTRELIALLPGSTVVGEEAAAADPALLDRAGAGAVWIVDPLDGTGNFKSGTPPFAIMVALAVDGVTQAGWIYDPVKDRMCAAALGEGAFIDGARVTAHGSGTPLPVAALAYRFMPPDERAAMERLAASRLTVVDIPACAGEQYPRIVLGENDVALFWRSLPWDHAPGALFLTEAGGRIAHLDGGPYRVTRQQYGLLAAATPALWDAAAAVLIDRDT